MRGRRIALAGSGFGNVALDERIAFAIGIAVGDGCITALRARAHLAMHEDEADVLAEIAAGINAIKADDGDDGRSRSSHVRDGATERYGFARLYRQPPHRRLFVRTDRDVFDLTEPHTHHFVANGLDVHNCSEYIFLDDTACFAPETRISTPDGLRTVEELYEQQESGQRVLMTTDIHSEYDHRRLSAHRPASSRRSANASLSHDARRRSRDSHDGGPQVLTATASGSALDELRPDQDRVAIRETGNAITYASDPAEVKRWQMLGWLTGDGVFSKDTVALVFGPRERRTAEFMTAQLNELKTMAVGRLGAGRRSTFAPTASTTQAQRRNADDCVRIVAGDYPRAALRLQTGDGNSQGRTRGDPSRTDNDLKVAYLQGLFSADGCIRTNASSDREAK